jgi:cytoskeletal protein RodZ
MDEQKTKGFLEEIQSLSDGTKKRVLVISTVIVMVIVIGVWMSYFNNIVMGTAQQATADATSTDQAAMSANNGPSFWQRVEGGFSYMGSIFRRSSNYSIQPQSN